MFVADGDAGRGWWLNLDTFANPGAHGIAAPWLALARAGVTWRLNDAAETQAVATRAAEAQQTRDDAAGFVDDGFVRPRRHAPRAGV